MIEKLWKSIFTTGTVVILSSGCSHSSPTKNLLSSDFLLGKNTKQLTFQGDNERPRFSADGEKIIFASRSRPHHKQAQIYEFNLKKNTERRVSFSDGDAFDPIYVGEDAILYASTTDEIKENPLKNFDKGLPPSELYMSDVYGGDILRLTTQPGYDGEGAYVYHPSKPFIVFSSRRGEINGIYRLDLKNMPVSFFNVEKGKSKRSPAVTTDGHSVAWIETDLESSEQKLMMAPLNGNGKKTPVMLKEKEGQYRDLFFGPSPMPKLYYSILRKGEKRYQLEAYDIEQKCTRVLFKGADSLFFPVISDQGRFIFVREFQDKKQIYMVDLPTDLGPCLEASIPAKLEK